MKKFIRYLFRHKTRLNCGGEGYCVIKDFYGREMGRLYYQRPDSDMRFDYTYALMNSLATEPRLREIESAVDKTKKSHEIMIRDLSLPFAQKLFVRSEGYKDDAGRKLEAMSKEEQFKHIAKYYVHHFISMVSEVFTPESVLKKNI
jgi:hypothetical protein